MKKIYFVISILFLTIILSMQFTTTVFAQDLKLETVEVDASKTKVAPGQEVTLNISFGKALGAYTITTEYDKDVFEYVRSEGGEANNQEGKVILTYYYSQNQGSPRTSAYMTFKAKSTIYADTPTDFSVTLSGLSNPDNSEEYEDITEPFKEDILVQPNYENYNLKLEYTGIILPKLEKNMNLITESALGKNYDHVRLIATVTKKPSKDATVNLFAIKEEEQIDLLHSGWGEEGGYQLGGKDVKQVLALRGEFSEIGDYTIHVKLIDRDNEDKTIAEKDFNLTVGQTKKEETTTGTNNNGQTTGTNNKGQTTEANKEKQPTTLPKAGGTSNTILIISAITLAIAYLYATKKSK